MRTPEDFIQAAVQRVEVGGDSIDWLYYQIMTEDDRKRFDKWLVDTQHPQAYVAGTTKSRFDFIIDQEIRIRARQRADLKRKWAKAGIDVTIVDGEVYIKLSDVTEDKVNFLLECGG